MEGMFFYWFTWIGWIWITFIMNRTSKARFSLGFCLLILLIASPYKYSIMGLEVYFVAIVITSYFIICTAKLKTKEFISLFVSAFIVMLGYVSFLLFELYDPVWVLFDRKWMIAISGILLSSVLLEDVRFRGLALLAGMLVGDTVFAVVMKRFSFSYPVSSPAFLDILAIMAMVMAIWSGFSYFAQLMSDYINQGRGKHKSS